MQALLLEVVAELLDPGLVGTGGWAYGALARTLARVLTVGPVDEVEVLGLGVVGLEVVVADRPGRRDAAVVA